MCLNPPWFTPFCEFVMLINVCQRATWKQARSWLVSSGGEKGRHYFANMFHEEPHCALPEMKVHPTSLTVYMASTVVYPDPTTILVLWYLSPFLLAQSSSSGLQPWSANWRINALCKEGLSWFCLPPLCIQINSGNLVLYFFAFMLN